jgi:hypothetical protein
MKKNYTIEEIPAGAPLLGALSILQIKGRSVALSSRDQLTCEEKGTPQY